jgi:hypothetical protein
MTRERSRYPEKDQRLVKKMKSKKAKITGEGKHCFGFLRDRKERTRYLHLISCKRLASK